MECKWLGMSVLCAAVGSEDWRESTHTHTHTHIHIYMHAYIRIYIYAYIIPDIITFTSLASFLQMQRVCAFCT
jgi:hypothetical protein